MTPSREVVALDEHVIADGERAAGQLELAAAERAGGAHVLAGARVEVGDVVAALGDHHRPRRARRRPTSRRRAARAVAPGVSSTWMRSCACVERERLLGAAVAERASSAARSHASTWRRFSVSSIARPRCDEPAERAAGLELGQLAVIADEHELAAGRSTCVEQPRELPRRDHAGLVDDEHAPLRAARSPRVEVAEQRGDARARDARRRARARARRVARPRPRAPGSPAGLPRLARGAERERLARPGLADHDRDAVAVAGRAARPSAAARPRASAAPRAHARTAVVVGHTGAGVRRAMRALSISRCSSASSSGVE